MQPVPVDLILHALAENLIGIPCGEHPDANEESLRTLGHTILRTCVDTRALPAQWCNGAGVGQQTEWLTRRLREPDMPTRVAAETRAMEVAIARRLADTGYSLLITQDEGDKTTAVTLLDAAHRVVGLPSAEDRAEDAASWQSRIAALEGQLKSLRESRASIAAENDAWRQWAVTHVMQDRPNAHDVTLMNAITERLMLTAIDAKTASHLRHKVATLERDHAALGEIEDATSKRAYDLALKIDAIKDALGVCGMSQEVALKTASDLRDKARRVDSADVLIAHHEDMYAALRKEADDAKAKCAYLQANLDARNTIIKNFDAVNPWFIWARQVLGVDDGNAKELQDLIAKNLERAKVLGQQVADLKAKVEEWDKWGNQNARGKPRINPTAKESRIRIERRLGEMSVIASALGIYTGATHGFIVDTIKCYRDAVGSITSALKLDPGASHSDIIETIKSLQADRAKLAEVVTIPRASAACPTFKVGDRVLATTFGGNARYATVQDNDATSPPPTPFGVRFAERLCLVRFDDDTEAYITERRLKALPKVDP